MKNILPILLFIITATVAFGQADSLKPTKKNIQLDFGFVHYRLIDEGFTQNKLLFRNTPYKLRLGYGRESIKSIFNFSAEISSGKIRSKESRLAAGFLFIKPSIEYLRKIRTYNFQRKQSQFFAGVHLSTTNYILHNQPIFDNVDIFSLHGIYFKFSNRLYLNNKHSLQFIYSMPTMVYANHILWNGGASDLTYSDRKKIIKALTTRGKFSYFNIFNNVQLKIAYIFKIGRNTDFVINYEFFYTSNDIQQPVHIYSNELLTGFKFKF